MVYFIRILLFVPVEQWQARMQRERLEIEAELLLEMGLEFEDDDLPDLDEGTYGLSGVNFSNFFSPFVNFKQGLFKSVTCLV